MNFNGKILVVLAVYSSLANAQYVKVSNDGHLLPDYAELGNGANDWACTYDIKYGLMWEVKQGDGEPRDKLSTYKGGTNSSIFIVPKATNLTPIDKNCRTGICSTDQFISYNNNKYLCGISNWRMPNVYELSWLLQCPKGEINNLPTNTFGNVCVYGFKSTSINNEFFPNSTDTVYWTGSAYLPSNQILSPDKTNDYWVVDFKNGSIYTLQKDSYQSVRLVASSNFNPYFLPPNEDNTQESTYDFTSWLLNIKEVSTPTGSYFLSLSNYVAQGQSHNSPTYSFSISRWHLVQGSSNKPAKYDPSTKILHIPNVFLTSSIPSVYPIPEKRNYSVDLIHDGNFIFKLLKLGDAEKIPPGFEKLID